MTDTTNTPEPSDEALAAQLNSFDPIRDVPSPVEVVGDVRITAEPTLQGLSPDMRAQAEAKLQGTPRTPEAVRRAITEVLTEHSRRLRIMAGAGNGATDTQRTMLQHANQVRLLGEEIANIERELGDVLQYQTDIDEAGHPNPVPVYRVQGSRRSALEDRLDEAKYEMALVAGVQGERELQAANRSDIARIRSLREEVAILREADRRAAHDEREARINELAAAKRKARRSNLG